MSYKSFKQLDLYNEGLPVGKETIKFGYENLPYGEKKAIRDIFIDLLKQNNMVKAQYERDCSSSIQNKICAHGKAAHWLILYATHLKSRSLEDGAMMCLKYAREFASKTRNRHLQNQVTQLIEAVQPETT